MAITERRVRHTNGEYALGTFKRPLNLNDKNLAFSVGFSGFLAHLKAAIDTLGQDAWIPAIDAGGDLRDGAWFTEMATTLDLGDWPTGMRVVARKERPRSGAQLTLTDPDGHRVTCFATNDPSPTYPPSKSATANAHDEPP
jgi:hypothetical protein